MYSVLLLSLNVWKVPSCLKIRHREADTSRSYQTGVCPAGHPLGGVLTVCGPEAPCQDGYECVTTGGVQYCCPSRS